MTIHDQHPDAEAIRKRARWWSTLWLGNGFGIVGYPRCAALANASLASWLVSILYFALVPTAASFWLVVALAVLFKNSDAKKKQSPCGDPERRLLGSSKGWLPAPPSPGDSAVRRRRGPDRYTDLRS